MSEKYNKTKKCEYMKVSDINPHIRYAMIHNMHLNNSNTFSICYDCRIFYIEHGSGSVQVNDAKYNISSGDTIYFPPKTKYCFNFLDNREFKIIILDFDLINDFSHIKSSIGTALEKDFVPEKVINYPICDDLSYPIIRHLPQAGHSLAQCTANFLSRDSFYREKSSALLKLCLLELLGHVESETAYTDLCKDVIKYIQKNYMQHDLSNTEIAENFNYHPYHLNRIIKQETGIPLHKHLTNYRIRIAKNYLLTTQYSVERIAWESGFSSTSYFIKMFRESTNTTPKKYRKYRFHSEM